jgi:hypothetical protein
VGGGRPGLRVGDERAAASDEDFVFDLDAGADERMTLDLAALSDHDPALDFDERPDACVVSEAAAVEIRERLDDHALTEFDIVQEA